MIAALAGLLGNVSGGAMIAICAGILVVSAIRGRIALAASLVVLTLTFTVVPRIFPWDRSEALHASVRPLHEFDNDAGFVISARTLRWNAAMNMARENPFFGVGAGNYQGNIGMYYFPAEKPGGRTDRVDFFDRLTDEPDSHNLYLVHAAETGIFGLLALAYLLAEFGAVGGRFLRDADGRLRADALACVGAVTGFALVAIFTNPMLRGVALPFAFLVAMALPLRADGNVTVEDGRGSDGETEVAPKLPPESPE
jgi:O-antigen ligase